MGSNIMFESIELTTLIKKLRRNIVIILVIGLITLFVFNSFYGTNEWYNYIVPLLTVVFIVFSTNHIYKVEFDAISASLVLYGYRFFSPSRYNLKLAKTQVSLENKLATRGTTAKILKLKSEGRTFRLVSGWDGWTDDLLLKVYDLLLKYEKEAQNII
ncbi:MAG: hypothetical protein H6548_10450 [Chitinophagales bacterium]|nr:hypothetical protein [Chitinophagales bacterium]HPE97720.1 hypothetical protein [Chitinophagales bacterium]HRX24413.1 hypothetical protein [Chitinophagales bacterium]